MPNKPQSTFAFGLVTAFLVCVVHPLKNTIPYSEEQGRQEQQELPCRLMSMQSPWQGDIIVYAG